MQTLNLIPADGILAELQSLREDLKKLASAIDALAGESSAGAVKFLPIYKLAEMYGMSRRQATRIIAQAGPAIARRVPVIDGTPGYYLFSVADFDAVITPKN